jgi:hypothetical protein
MVGWECPTKPREASGLDPEAVHTWAGEAASRIEEASTTKEEYLEEDYAEGLDELFWEDFESNR